MSTVLIQEVLLRGRNSYGKSILAVNDAEPLLDGDDFAMMVNFPL